MPETTISRAQAPTTKLYDVNGSALLENPITRSADGRVTLAHPEIKRQAFVNPCSPSTSFWNGISSCITVGGSSANRANFCNRPVRVASGICETTKDCSPYVFGQTQVTSYFTYTYIYAYDGLCNFWSETCNGGSSFTKIYYATGTNVGSRTDIIPTTTAKVQSIRTLNGDGTEGLISRDCAATALCSASLTVPNSWTRVGAVSDPNTGCTGVITLNNWNTLVQSANEYCNYVPPTDPPTTQAPTTEATTEPPTNETLNSTSVDALPSPSTSSAESFNNVISVDLLPSSSQEILQTHASLLPSVIPETPAGNGLALLGLLAIAPVGLGIVAAGVGAYGIYKWCHPDKEPEEDIEMAEKPYEAKPDAITESVVDLAQQKAQEIEVAETSVYEPVDEPVYEAVDEPVDEPVAPSADTNQGWYTSIAKIANWISRNVIAQPYETKEEKGEA